MLRDTAVDLIMRRLGFRKDTARRADIISEMVITQEMELESKPELPWFLKTRSYFYCAVSTPTAAYDTDFIMLAEEPTCDITHPDTGVSTMLDREDYQDLYVTYLNAAAGLPKYFDILGTNIMLLPLPDAEYTGSLIAYHRAASLAGTYGSTGNIENLWLKHAADVLIGETGKAMATSLQSAAIPYFTDMAARGWDRVLRETTAFEEAGKTRRMGP